MCTLSRKLLSEAPGKTDSSSRIHSNPRRSVCRSTAPPRRWGGGGGGGGGGEHKRISSDYSASAVQFTGRKDPVYPLAPLVMRASGEVARRRRREELVG